VSLEQLPIDPRLEVKAFEKCRRCELDQVFEAGAILRK
jgi:hypothetical protein